jgi:hypothetical protein
MKDFKAKGFAERLTNAAKARQSNLEKFGQRPAPDDPEQLKKQAARAATAEARKQRAAEREEQKAVRKREQAEREAQAAAEKLREEALAAERQAALAAEQKAARDQRYAARKARK